MILLFYKSEGLRESIAFGQHFDIARHMSNNSEAFNVTFNQCTHCVTEKQHCQASASTSNYLKMVSVSKIQWKRVAHVCGFFIVS